MMLQNIARYPPTILVLLQVDAATVLILFTVLLREMNKNTKCNAQLLAIEICGHPQVIP